MNYAKPKTAAEAARLLKAETGVTRVLAGGTDVLVQLKAGMIEPDLIVDIKDIPGIRGDHAPKRAVFASGRPCRGRAWANMPRFVPPGPAWSKARS